MGDVSEELQNKLRRRLVLTEGTAVAQLGQLPQMGGVSEELQKIPRRRRVLTEGNPVAKQRHLPQIDDLCSGMQKSERDTSLAKPKSVDGLHREMRPVLEKKGLHEETKSQKAVSHVKPSYRSMEALHGEQRRVSEKKGLHEETKFERAVSHAKPKSMYGLHREQLQVSEKKRLHEESKSATMDSNGQFDNSHTGGLECLVCTEEDVEVLCRGCGNVLMCNQCSQRLMMCPLCRAPMSGRIPVNKGYYQMGGVSEELQKIPRRRRVLKEGNPVAKQRHLPQIDDLCGGMQKSERNTSLAKPKSVDGLHREMRPVLEKKGLHEETKSQRAVSHVKPSYRSMEALHGEQRRVSEKKGLHEETKFERAVSHAKPKSMYGLHGEQLQVSEKKRLHEETKSERVVYHAKPKAMDGLHRDMRPVLEKKGLPEGFKSERAASVGNPKLMDSFQWELRQALEKKGLHEETQSERAVYHAKPKEMDSLHGEQRLVSEKKGLPEETKSATMDSNGQFDNSHTEEDVEVLCRECGNVLMCNQYSQRLMICPLCRAPMSRRIPVNNGYYQMGLSYLKSFCTLL